MAKKSLAAAASPDAVALVAPFLPFWVVSVMFFFPHAERKTVIALDVATQNEFVHRTMRVNGENYTNCQ
jgi:hypothetical protein